DETEQRVLEGGGPVMLEEEVPCPGTRVALDQRQREKPPVLRDHGGNDQHGGNRRAGKMQPAAHRVGVLAQIERVKLGKCTQRPGLAHERVSSSQFFCVTTTSIRVGDDAVKPVFSASSSSVTRSTRIARHPWPRARSQKLISGRSVPTTWGRPK